MFKALLFDLDGTLLPLDLELFIQKYFEKLAPFFAHKIEPEILIKELWTSTMSMLKNSGTLTNEEVFMASFLPAIKQEKMVMYPLFEVLSGGVSKVTKIFRIFPLICPNYWTSPRKGV